MHYSFLLHVSFVSATMSFEMKSFIGLIKHYLFPHASNNYKAKSLHVSSLLFYVTLLLLIQFSVKTFKKDNPDILGYSKDVTVTRLLSLVNQKRQEAGLSSVELSPLLTTAATNKGNDMFTNNYWAHISPSGKTPWEFIRGAGYDYEYAGENLAKSFDTSDQVVAAWMNSPTHRANILKPEYTEMGLAVINGKLQGEETTLVVQEFGTRVVSKPVVRISPEAINPAKQAQAAVIPEVAVNGFSSTTVETLPVKTQFNPLKSFSMILGEFLLVVLAIDGIYMWKCKPHRLSSRTLAHIIFIGALIGAMGATGVGAIL